ncbi:hypothetical protein B0A55_10340 [Friedmanniomyces simplex]|uniref:WKF domain-containing protein n=1 Tax=Friedmanniomyces simplex TaxID=329884 RepID=A0A4U0WJF2_9PEZI|nr:hypothetical protein B0A55_10340 [Friedmanniomyces simplex]
MATTQSVTFTPDTKTEDTFSAQRLFEEWSAAEAEQTSAIQTSLLPQPSEETEIKPSKKRAKAQKRTAEDQDQVSPESDPSARSPLDEQPEYVRYLQQYYSDKANWKFNKKKQKDLLKNLFNTSRVPATHDVALLAYLKGLGGAAAQQRVLEEAEGVLKSLLDKQGRSDKAEDMESRGARRAAYEAALRREIDTLDRAGGGRSEYSDQQLQEIRRDVERGKRADAILVELLGNELAYTPAHSHEVLAEPTPQPAGPDSTTDADTTTENTQKSSSKRRKRKARTEVSSDESSSDSSSESEGEAPRGTPLPRAAIPTTTHNRSVIDPASANAYGFGNRPTKPSGKKKIFDDDFLDEIFPKKTYYETAPKRWKGDEAEARRSNNTDATSVDESGSEEEE